ncbi:MAG: DUF3179 domain-containing protein [Rhodospirillales bacterium]|nr:DUF3179 domain-containing protein [Rhodospirillales bacterium]
MTDQTRIASRVRSHTLDPIPALLAVLAVFAAVLLFAATAKANPMLWAAAWPKTDFSKKSIDYSEILSGGPPKDGIPSIDKPKFIDAKDDKDLGPNEPVISFEINGEAKAYPLRILMWHEIVNDTLGGVPVTVTYCPLCNSSIVFDRRLDGLVLDFGTTGKLRNSDLVMYDRQTESWWQQFLGEGIVGKMTGKMLKMLPSRQESFSRYKAQYPKGKVLVPNNSFMRRYGTNPYARYDSRSGPYPFFQGEMPKGINPMVRVVAVGKQAWSLPLIRDKGPIRTGGLEIRWEKGLNSALDSSEISEGKDVGNIIVQRTKDGKKEDVVHDVTFAFVFHAFHPKGKINTN